MRCEDIRDRLIDAAAEQASSPEGRRVLAHLQHCDRCRHEARRTTETWALLTAIPDEEPDSDAMRARFAAALRDHRANERRSAARGPLSIALPAWRLLRAAALLVALGGGVLLGRAFPAHERIAQGDFAAMRQELEGVRQMLTLSLLHQAAASERIRGVSAAGQLEDLRADVLATLVDTMRHDSSVNVRLACVRALARFKDQPSVRQAVVAAVATEDSPLVSIALIDFIVDSMDGTAVDALRQLSRDAARDAAVRETAARGVEQLLDGGRL